MIRKKNLYFQYIEILSYHFMDIKKVNLVLEEKVNQKAVVFIQVEIKVDFIDHCNDINKT